MEDTMKYLKQLFLALTMCSPMAGAAQDFPAKPIRWIVPYSTGGVSDVAARYLAQEMSKHLGGPIIVENRTGAGGLIGTEYVANAPADGYTWVWGGTAALATNLALKKTLPYDPIKDFVPICRIATAPQILVTKPSLNTKSLDEFIALAKSKPLWYASAGNGTGGHISMELLKSLASISLEHVAYKGTAPAVTDLLGGHVDTLFESAGPLIPHIRSGSLIALGTTSGRRLVSLPDIPTFQELGYAEFRVEAWTALLLPADTPKPIVERVEAAGMTVLQDPATQAKITELGLENYPANSAELGEFMKTEIGAWARLVELAKVEVD